MVRLGDLLRNVFAQPIAAGGHPVHQVLGEQLQPRMKAPLVQQPRLVIEKVLDFQAKLGVRGGSHEYLLAMCCGHGFAVMGECLPAWGHYTAFPVMSGTLHRLCRQTTIHLGEFMRQGGNIFEHQIALVGTHGA